MIDVIVSSHTAENLHILNKIWNGEILSARQYR